MTHTKPDVKNGIIPQHGKLSERDTLNKNKTVLTQVITRKMEPN